MVDNKDLIILEILENNAKTKYLEIANKLNITQTAVRKRIKKLEKEKVLLGYRANINYKKLGFSNKVVMGVDTTPNDYLVVVNKLSKIEEIKNLTLSSGDHMIMFEVWIKNIEDLNNILEKINSIQGVVKSCPAIIQNDFK